MFSGTPAAKSLRHKSAVRNDVPFGFGRFALFSRKTSGCERVFVYLYTSERLSFRVFEQFEIDFSRRDMFMSQHFAYGVDISSIRQLQDCIGVAETVECDTLGNAGFSEPAFQRTIKHIAVESFENGTLFS